MEDCIILYVDNNKKNIDDMNKIADDSDFMIICFDNPVKAIKFVEKNDFDIAFINYSLPIIDGISLIRVIKSYNPQIPIVLITSSDCEKDITESATSAGATKCYMESLNNPDFNDMVHSLL